MRAGQASAEERLARLLALQLGSNRGMRSSLAVPLVCLGRTIGVLHVEAPEVDAFDESDVQLLEGLATQVAGAIERARRHDEVLELEWLKSDFITRVSHELRTPLTVVCGFTETLLDLWPRLADEERFRILQRMQAAAGRLHRVVDELVAVAAYETGVVPRPADVPAGGCGAQVEMAHPEAGGVLEPLRFPAADCVEQPDFDPAAPFEADVPKGAAGTERRD